MRNVMLVAAVLVAALTLVGTAKADPVTYGEYYIATSTGDVYTVDTSDASLTHIVDTGSYVWLDIAFDPSGNLYGIAGTTLYTIDLGTNTVSTVGSTTYPSLQPVMAKDLECPDAISVRSAIPG